MAVTTEHWSLGPKMDPKYIQWVGSYNVQTNGVYEEIYFPLHPCTESDYNKFYPPSDTAAGLVNKKREDNLFYCTPDLSAAGIEDLYGIWSRDSSYAAIEFHVWPCATKWTSIDGVEYGGHDDCIWDRQAVLDYLGETQKIMIYHNEAQFKQEGFGEDRIEFRSSLSSVFFGTEAAQFTQAWLRKYTLVDEIEYFQLGQSEDDTFVKPFFESSQNSAVATWPTKENPYSIYKINGLWIELSPVLTTIERSTYSLLEWFGDVGGLLEALKIIGGSIAAPFAMFALKAKLLFLIFGEVESRQKRQTTDTTDTPQITQTKQIRVRGFVNNFTCGRPDRRRYKRMMRRGMNELANNLDLVKFVQSQRMMMLAVLTMLKPSQQHLVNQMSALVINESSDLVKLTTSDSDKGEALRSFDGVNMEEVVKNVL